MQMKVCMGRRKAGIAMRQEQGAKIMTRNTDYMPDVREPVTARPSLAHRMDHHRMSESDRRLAEESLREGESLADHICRAKDALRSTASLLANYFAQRAR
jgi:hypothetical protein